MYIAVILENYSQVSLVHKMEQYSTVWNNTNTLAPCAMTVFCLPSGVMVKNEV